MSHYWMADDPPETRLAQIEDWIEDLVEFDVSVVEHACREWRRMGLRRPVPAQIRDLAIQETVYREQLKERESPPPPKSYDELANECRNRWLSCRARWLIRGCICHGECKSNIQEYYPREVESTGRVPYLDEQQAILDEYFGNTVIRL